MYVLCRKDFDVFVLPVQGEDLPRKESLPPPAPRNVTWSEYIQSAPGKFPCLGRKQVGELK